MMRPALLAPLLLAAAVVYLGGCAGIARPGAGSVLSRAWTLSGSKDLVLFDNGQCVRISSESRPGARGARGYYRQGRAGVLCLFDDGSVVELAARGSGYFWTTDSPGESRRKWQPAARCEPPRNQFVGLWRLTPEPTGEYLYVQLHADGSARNSLVPTPGKWELWNGGALCTWEGGWRDWLSVRDDAIVHRAWPPGSPLTSEPSDFSVALRIGEKPYVISP